MKRPRGAMCRSRRDRTPGGGAGVGRRRRGRPCVPSHMGPYLDAQGGGPGSRLQEAPARLPLGGGPGEGDGSRFCPAGTWCGPGPARPAPRWPSPALGRSPRSRSLGRRHCRCSSSRLREPAMQVPKAARHGPCSKALFECAQSTLDGHSRQGARAERMQGRASAGWGRAVFSSFSISCFQMISS